MPNFFRDVQLGHARQVRALYRGQAKMLTDEDIAHRTAHHPPTSTDVTTAHHMIRLATAEFLEAIRDHSPPCREQSVAITHAENAMMWANAAIARTQKTGPTPVDDFAASA